MKSDLEGYQRAELFRQAHHLSPVVTVGKDGASAAVLDHLERELNNHELIKVRFSDFKEDRKTLSKRMAEESAAVVVGVIGHIAILYRQHPDESKRRVNLPER